MAALAQTKQSGDTPIEITRARWNLIHNQPWFGTLALYLKLIERPDEEIPTMATDGTRLYWSRKFVNSLSKEHLSSILAHEVMHCALAHCTRRGERDPRLWNVATDIVINAILVDSGFSMPYEPMTYDQMINEAEIARVSKREPRKGFLLDRKFDGMEAEEVYSRLYKEHPPQKSQVVVIDGYCDPSGMGGVIDAQPQDGEGKGGDGKQQGCGVTQAEREEIEREWNIRIKQATNSAKAAGKLPGHIERIVGELMEPEVDWRMLLRDFVEHTVPRDYSWTKPNRRFAWQGLYLPGVYKENTGKVLVWVDTSGSITNELLNMFASEVTAVIQDTRPDGVYVGYIDTQVHRVDHFEPDDEVRMGMYGGGGTHFDDAMDWTAKKLQEEDIKCVLFFTDMYTGSFGADPGIPVMWLRYGSCKTEPPFGKVVPVKED